MTNNWNNETIIDFINEVHLHPELWNVEAGTYKDRVAKKDGWTLIGEKFGISSDEAYKKFRSLRTYAKNEDNRKKKSGSAGDKPIKWFAYDAISFIFTQNTPNEGLGSENAPANVPETPETPEALEYDNTENIVVSESVDTLSTSPRPRVTSKKPKNTDPILDKAQQIICDAVEKRKNEYASFGEHIANKLTKYDDCTRARAEFKIMQVLFECDMAMYKIPASSIYTESSRRIEASSLSHYSDMSTNSPQNDVQYIIVPETEDYTVPLNTVEQVIVPESQNTAPDEAQLPTNSAYEELVTLTVQ